MSRYRRHVFVCTNTRPDGGKPSCGGRGGVELVGALQRAVATSEALVGEVAVTPCGCLGPCFEGPMLVVYPEGTWLGGMGVEDVEEVVRWMETGEEKAAGVVERKRYRWEEVEEEEEEDPE